MQGRFFTNLKCSDELLYNGQPVFTVKHLDPRRIENWVNQITEKSKQKLDGTMMDLALPAYSL